MHKPTASDLLELEQQLRGMRRQVLGALHARLGGADPAQPRSLEAPADEDEQALRDMFTDTEIALVRHELADLREIDLALKRIEFDVAGVCMNCGAPIPIERLRALPTATTCIACARAAPHTAH